MQRREALSYLSSHGVGGERRDSKADNFLYIENKLCVDYLSLISKGRSKLSCIKENLINGKNIK